MDTMQTGGHAGTNMQLREGDDFVCSNCGCEITLKHHGDPAKMPNMRPFTCCCGTRMEPEHAERGGQRAL